jgi:hypothetical protein
MSCYHKQGFGDKVMAVYRKYQYQKLEYNGFSLRISIQWGFCPSAHPCFISETASGFI